MTNIDKYRQGYERGIAAIENSRGEKPADMPEKVVKGVIGLPREAITDFFRSPDEDRGYRDAIDGKDFDPRPNVDAPVENRGPEEPQHERSERSNEPSGGNSGTDFLVKIVVGGLIFFAIVWFVFAVAIPLLLIDIALIALIGAVIRREISKWLLPLSVLGAVMVVADHNRGGVAKEFATNVPFMAGMVPVLFYVNVFAGLIAAYLLIRNFMDGRNPPPENAGDLTRRNVITVGCLLLVGCLTVGLQAVVDSQRKQARQTTATVNPANSGVNVATPVVGTEQGQPKPMITTDAFAGDWQYTNSQGNISYLRIVKMKSGQFQLFEGWTGNQGAVNWRQDGYYLAPANGKLTATIQSGNFRATHGNVFEYQLMVERIDDNNLMYTVKSELTNANEAEKASRIEQATSFPVGNQAFEPALGAKPSFNCSKATTPTERLICRDGELASAELQEVAAHDQLLKQLSGSEAAAFRAEHMGWFKNWSKTCNAIGKSQPEAELRACIVQFLSDRTQQLRARIR